MIDAVILGSGISGLAAGHAARLRGLKSFILEQDRQPGGKMRTLQVEDFLFELGPNAIQSSEPFLELCRAAGCHDQLVLASPEAKKRWVVHRGRLEELPGGPGELLSTPLLGTGARLRLLREPLQGLGAGPEESVADFARRRLGRGTLHLVDAMISGIYAGDPEELAVGYAFPTLYGLEQEKGSLLRGALAQAKRAKKAKRSKGRRETAAPKKPRRQLVSFSGGLAAFARSLAEDLDIRYGHTIESVEALDSEAGFIVRGRAGGESFAFRTRRVLSTLPATAAAEVLAPLGNTDDFKLLPHAPIAVLGLGYRAEDVPHALDGFGFLAPIQEKRDLLGCLFPSSLFPDRAPKGHHALTVMIGGRRRPDLVELDDEALFAVARRELSELLGIRKAPVVRTALRWGSGGDLEDGGLGIAQATADVGRVRATADGLQDRHSGLYLLGDWLRGVGLPKAIEAGWQALKPAEPRDPASGKPA